MADKNVQADVTPDVKADDKGADEPYLGTYKTKADAEAGLTELNSKLGSQGSELGAIKKQVEFFQNQLERAQTQPKAEPKEAPQGPDYGKEMKTIQDKITQLDPDEPGYQKDLGKLIMASNQLATQQATDKTLSMAQAQFKEALDERDIASTHKDFFRDNPDFNTPEMQMRIQENLANDRTGMSDPMVAYREIQRDDAAQEAAAVKEENAELKRLLALKAGENETGKVVTKGQSSTQQKTKQPKATGAELDKGMQGALDALRA